MNLAPVAAGVPPAVEGGVPPPGTSGLHTRFPPGKMPGSTAGETPAATDSGRPASARFMGREQVIRDKAASQEPPQSGYPFAQHPESKRPACRIGKRCARWKFRNPQTYDADVTVQ